MTEHPTLFADPHAVEAIAPNKRLVVIEAPDQEEGLEDHWRDDPSIVCTEQPAIKVYTNPLCQAVIRQERSWDESDDRTIFVSREYAIAVCAAILRAAGMGDIEFVRPCGGGYEDVEVPPPLGPRLSQQKEKKNGKQR